MLKQYKPTDLEKTISNFLIQNDIIYPSQLNPYLISRSLDIDYEPAVSPAFSIEEEGIPFIVTDSRCSLETQKEQFFHELGHLLRHEGDQRNRMPQLFREYQEWDANLFALYAMIPYHMIDFSLSYTVKKLVDQFEVPLHIAKKRFYQIRKRLFFSGSLVNDSIKPKKTYELAPYDLSCRSAETKRLIAQLNKQTGVINL